MLQLSLLLNFVLRRNCNLMVDLLKFTLQQKWTIVTKLFVTICPYFFIEDIWWRNNNRHLSPIIECFGDKNLCSRLAQKWVFGNQRHDNWWFSNPHFLLCTPHHSNARSPTRSNFCLLRVNIKKIKVDKVYNTRVLCPMV